MSALPTEAELATIKRGMSLVLVGFVLGGVAEGVFAAAEYFLDNPMAKGAPRIRPPDVPDPDFAYLLPILMVILIAVLIEAGGKIMSMSRPERWRYGFLHFALAFDLIAVVGVLLRLFNYGRTAGRVFSALEAIDFYSLGSQAALAVFAAELGARLGRRRLVNVAVACLMSIVVLVVAAPLIGSSFASLDSTVVDPALVDSEPFELRGPSILLLAVAAASGFGMIATFLTLLTMVHGLTLPPSTSPSRDASPTGP